MEKILLKQTDQFLFFDEDEAYAYVNEVKGTQTVEDAKIKRKKETAKKMEHWIVEVTTRKALLDDHISTGE